MIFVTTGTQEPFDRLLEIIAEFAKSYAGEVVIQAKTTLTFPPNVKVVEFLNPKEFNHFFMSAKLVVSHAGMGTIISALNNNRPIVIFPRKASLGEHRNEHQMATAKKMSELGYVYVNQEENDFLEELKLLSLQESITPLYSIASYASDSLMNSLEDFIKKNR